MSFFIILLGFSHAAYSQSSPRSHLGSKKDFIQKLKDRVASNKMSSEETEFVLNLSSNFTVKSKINYFSKGGTELFTGEISFPYKGQISITVDAIEGLSGHIYSLEKKAAYSLKEDQDGQVYADSVDISQILCIEYDHADTSADTLVVQEALDDTPDAYKLQSLPTATAVIYLDFDGETVSGTSWASGATIVAPATPFSQTSIKRIWKMVSEDYMPFNINVTTDRAMYDKAPRGRRTQCIFTSNDQAAPGAGGVAYLRSFRSTATIANPCWVFNSGVKSAGEAASHEVGHTMGLSHDGRLSPSESYFKGHGNWAPIMGAGYYETFVHWSKGEYTSANNKEDDLAIISGISNGFGYKADDHSNDITSATPIKIETNGTVLSTQNEGIISKGTDVDVFKFTTSGGTVSLQIKPAATDPNLDVSVRIVKVGDAVVTTVTSTGTVLSASINKTLTEGTYFIEVDGIGDGDPLSTGYSDYGSLGFYTISGTIPIAPATNIAPTIAITGPANNASFIAPANIVITATATDQDGTVTKVEFFNGSIKLSEDLVAPYSYTWSNIAAGTYNVTTIATDDKGATKTSTAVVIKVTAPNSAPVVTITSPLDNDDYTAPASVTITATATDSDGTIKKVEFYNGTDLLYSDNTAAYSFTWNNVVAGTYEFTAVAYDNLDSSTVSSIVSVIVINDEDKDGVTDELDNCKSVHNVSQADVDNNGVGDACENAITGVTDAEADLTVKVAPNPFGTSTTVTLPGIEKATVKLYNMEGKVVLETRAAESLVIDNSFSPGIYFLIVITKDKVFNKKLVRE